MISFRRSSLLLFAFLITPIILLATENERKDKKALIEYIKSDFHSWSSDSKEHATNVSHLQQTKEDKAACEKKVMSKKSESHGQQPSANFDDFECTIVNSQAIVEFTVDDLKISAFFEKVNGSWKLICAAEIDGPA